jgi:L-ribulokinase
METEFLIGLDYGSESARGVLVGASSGEIVANHSRPYRYGVMTTALPNGQPLPPEWALQNAPDYLEVAEALLAALGRGRRVRGIGVGFTASSPMPAGPDASPLSDAHPDEPHAYVKLWKHHSAQPWADRINARGGAFLNNFGGKLSSEWLLPKAAQIADEAPQLWSATHRLIEAGDWVVWRLVGREARSSGFAAYKARYTSEAGYPADVVPALLDKLTTPLPVGGPAGPLAAAWRSRCGIEGEPIVAVAVIDSHVMMPAVGATQAGTFVGALGTSAAYLLLDDRARPLPPGIEGVARDGVIPGLWCYEAGQPAFGDGLGWFMRNFSRGDLIEESFVHYNSEASDLRPGETGLLALDWWNGSRAPLADSLVSGLLLGIDLKTTAVDVYRALLESLCYGARNILEHLAAGGAPIEKIILASGITEKNPFLLQLMADIFGRTVEVPEITHAAAVGAAIHGAVAAGLVPNFACGARRYGAKKYRKYSPNGATTKIYDRLFERYQALSADPSIRQTMHAIRTLQAG